MPPEGEFSQLTAEAEQESDVVKDEALAALEKKLDEAKDKRNEERFCWILLTVILIDAHIFLNSNNSAGPIALVVLQAVLLIILAKVHGVQEVSVLLDKAINAWKKD